MIFNEKTIKKLSIQKPFIGYKIVFVYSIRYTFDIVDIFVLGIEVSQDMSAMCDGCLLSFVPDPSRDTSGLWDDYGAGGPLILFPDSGAVTSLLRVRHSTNNASYVVEIIGTNLQCRQGIMDVFLQNGCPILGCTGLAFTECKREAVKIELNGIVLCTYICTPSTETDTIFIRVKKANHISASYGSWSINSVSFIHI